MRRALAVAAIALTVLVAGGAAADTFTVNLVSQTSSTITLGWSPQPGYGYLFSAGGKLVSRTNDASRASVKFSKVTPASYEVAVIVKGAIGTYPPPPTGDTTPPSAPPNLTATAVTQTSVTVGWGDSTDNIGVVNYRVYRNGGLIGQGPGSSGGFPNTWVDAGRTCGTTYTYDVEAQDAAGNTGLRTTLAVKTTDCSVPQAACGDQIDNDSDLLVDYPADPGCTSATDTDESNSPPSGQVVEITGTVTAAAFLSRINSAPAGPITVRPAAGQASFTVSGDFTLARQNVTIQHAVMRDVTVREAGSGFVIEDSDLHSFDIDGADNWVIQRDNVHFDGVSYTTAGSQFMYGATNWKILDSTFTGFYSRANPSWHTEAWFIGDGNDGGLIQGNRFDDNGTTAHLFFTWWGQSGSGPGDPKNICVTGNTFTRSHNAYWHIDLRSELNFATNNIDFDPNTNTWDKPFPYTVLAVKGVRPC